MLAVAVRSRADLIVTSNLKHFPTEACEPFCVEPISPDDFLCQLLDASEQSIKQVIEQFAEDKKNPPMAVDDVLEALSRSVPLFSERAAGLF